MPGAAGSAPTPRPPEVRVLVVDDQRPFRLAAAAVLRRTAGFTLVGEASSGAEALHLVAALHPDLVLLDIRMPDVDGIVVARRLRVEHPDVVVVLASTYQRSDVPEGVTDSGAAAYLHKEELAPGLLVRLWADATGSRAAEPPTPVG